MSEASTFSEALFQSRTIEENTSRLLTDSMVGESALFLEIGFDGGAFCLRDCLSKATRAAGGRTEGGAEGGAGENRHGRRGTGFASCQGYFGETVFAFVDFRGRCLIWTGRRTRHARKC